MDLRVAAYAVITDDSERVLLAHWVTERHAAWTMPGGGMEPGEHPAETARREVQEETGYDARVGDLLGIDTHVIPAARRLTHTDAAQDLQALRIVYRATITGGELRDEVGGSTDTAAWFRLDEVAKLERVALVDTALSLAGLA